MRKGMMVGSGKRGYHNIIGKDPSVHSQSAQGIKQPQRIPFEPNIRYKVISQKEWNETPKDYKRQAKPRTYSLLK